MAFDDIVAVVVLLIAYAFTVFLFVSSLRIVKIIHSEKIYHLNEIKKRLFTRKGGS